ncbi:glutathione S-transferase family protein [Rhodobacteraceae bacterium CCMM004]|nr:glutathione S-transferase family protein [Rhodobacteraceae bacterium CCMM004]
MTDLTLYTNPMSRGRTARAMLEEVGQPYAARIVPYGPEMQSADYRHINPMAKVPALVHGEAVVTEVAAICAYLADAFPDAGLAPPPGDPSRGPYYRWLFFAAGPFEMAITVDAMGWDLAPEREATVGWGSTGRMLDALEGMLADTEWVTGRFSAADVFLGSSLAFALRFGTVEARPAFEAYAARVTARPAFLRAAAADDAAMAGA